MSDQLGRISIAKGESAMGEHHVNQGSPTSDSLHPLGP